MNKFKIGDRIKHRHYPYFGVGVIKAIEEWGHEIEFENKTDGRATYPNCKKEYGYFVGDAHNLELVDTFTLPEKWCIKITEENRDTVKTYFDNLYPDIDYNYSLGVLYSNIPCTGRGIQTSNDYDLFDCTEITFEQFKKHVLNDNNNMTTKEQRNEVSKGEQGSTTQTFKVTRQALAEVFPLVCSNYRDKINKLSQKDLFSNELEVSENIVRQAHKDAQSKHKEWLDKYLPLPKKKKIELTHCLQTTSDWCESGYWNLEVGTTYKKAHEMGFEDIIYDVIIGTDAEGYINVYLGYWNDGITEG